MNARLLSLMFLTFLLLRCTPEVEEVDTTPINVTTNNPLGTLAYNGIPRILIRTDNNASVDSREEYVSAEISIFKDSNTILESNFVKIRGRGNSTWATPKKPYQIKFDEKEEVLGMPENKRWILLANYRDKSMLRNEVGFFLSRKSRMEFTPESRFAELILNGEYLGTYQITQKVEESKNRVDIDDGYLIEADQLERLKEDDVYFYLEHFLCNIKAPDLASGDEKYTYIHDFMLDAEAAIFSEDFLDEEIGYRKYIDVDAFIDWYLINEITKNNDADFHTSTFMSLIPGGKLKLGPVWDFDISAGNINYNGNENPEDFWMKRGDWVTQFYKDPEFVSQLKERYSYFSSLKQELYEDIRSNAAYIEDSQKMNFEKWPILGEYIWPNYVYFDTYEEEVDYLIDWMETRFEWLDIAIADL